MALTKTPTTLVNNQTIAANSTYSSTVVIDLSGAIDFYIGYSMSFNASSIAGAKIELFADPTGANASYTISAYDDAVDSYDIAVDAGHTAKGGAPFNRSAKYATVKVTNLSTTQSITACYVYGIVQAQS